MGTENDAVRNVPLPECVRIALSEEKIEGDLVPLVRNMRDLDDAAKLAVQLLENASIDEINLVESMVIKAGVNAIANRKFSGVNAVYAARVLVNMSERVWENSNYPYTSR